ncbi:hypothetical protein CO057_01790 [Candidatus Uhrbacteria bacterium CG_4_9_14_0_2_um_filter_41_50]|uniref:Uncharacterized protein n=1 Tax=Candidatus Uhrbacteria bacterium CG_4_9_14_0_2_um_filter_41_50 TaxID=1975031 RepID=A0A2M8EPJ2_9BACT|nr:MAG: hypothetical protein COZ45_00970 [Candidatus Uhrbacteria bacterium CG_4_10_14_3_um_filter_41_21]PIZ55427.1 MAG: hypothetical protein COY24_00475 [Candidatus Uhrbacteria bacterium CG_4_10_14_0_2_um_filter_41_21]PJB84971.1 MAG: hypothetical protein CO086_00820 [Candidatus Uhrbacteria bacterium CG_4_9_14_0_8_um_filter_41_16]PJC24658.1 MAG: hypothetical protein CO057_01790 [Candidatus Uhrbacteria bacterium CG_4_9_14_0_2_um_filter_41_50]PJE75200.1 MAG: hypothetical protein COV03_01530 [Candi
MRLYYIIGIRCPGPGRRSVSTVYKRQIIIEYFTLFTPFSHITLFTVPPLCYTILMNQEKALARNTAIQIIGKTMATMLGVVTVAILARHLGVAGYGQFTIALSFLSIFAVIVDFGLTLTTTQMISEHKADEETLLGNLLSLRIISAVIFLALAPIIALLFPYDNVILMAIAVGSVSYLFGTTSQMLIGIYQKRLIIGRAIVAEVANRAIVMIGVLLCPIFNIGLIGVIWILVLGNAVQLFLMVLLARKYVKLRLKIKLGIWKEIIKRSWPIGASIFFNLIYLRGDIVFLSLFRSNAEVGIYGAAYKVVDVVASIPVMYMGITLPILVAAWSAHNSEKFKKIMQKSFDFFAIAAIPVIFGSIAIGVPLMEWIAGAEFSESGRVLAILGPAVAVVFFGSLFGHAIVAIQKQKPMTWGYLAVAVLTVAGYIYFIPTYGMWAAAWLTLFSEALITILTFTVIFKVSDYRPKIAMATRAILASIVMFLLLRALPNIHVVFSLLLAMVVYAIALTALGGPKLKDVMGLFLPEKPTINI